jgi:hypothetical protein
MSFACEPARTASTLRRWLALVCIAPHLASAAESGGPAAQSARWGLDYPLLVLIAIFAFTGVLVWYAWALRNRISDALSGNMDASVRLAALSGYCDWPLGLPRGTVRALLALVIVFGSIAFLALSTAIPDRYKFPDALTGILGAILGFYFGKSGSAGEGQAVAAMAAANAAAQDAMKQANDANAQSQNAQAETAAANQALEDVKAQHDDLASGRLEEITGDLQNAVQVGQTLASVLPGNFGKSVGTAATALSNTLAAVTELRKGDLTGAVQQALKVVDQAAPNMPVVSVLTKAVQAMGPVLGGSIPPVALITTLIGIGGRLGSAAYAHWVARIMDQPYTPEQFSPKVFDSNAAESLIMQVPSVLKALQPQLAAGNRDMALDVVRLALAGDGGATLVGKYAQAFAGFSQAGIDSAVRDLQKAALDFVLGRELPADAGKSVGGLSAVLKAVDQVRSNPDASAALDMVMTTAKTLAAAQMHPELEFNKAAEILSRPNPQVSS